METDIGGTMRVQIIAATAALIGSGLMVATSTAATASEEAPLVSGTITDANGRVAEGAKVAVFVEPAASEKLKEGQTLTFTPIGTATTDANGKYTVTYDTSVDLAKYIDSSNQLNLSVAIQSGGSVFTTIAQPEVDSQAGVVTAARATAANPRFSVAPGRADLKLTSPASRITRAKAASTNGARASSAENPVLPQAVTTSVSVVKNYGGRKTVVGTWVSDTANVRQSFTYSRSAKSSLGLAVSSTGKAGSFKKGGTKSKSSTAAVGFGTQKGKGAWRYNTEFNYQKRKYTYCVNGQYCWSEYKIEPMYWIGGATRSSAPNYSANHCVKQAAGTSFTIAKTDAWTFATGVSNSGMTVVDLSSETGFSSTAKQSITFTKKGRLCGKNGPPAQKPAALRAKAA